MLHKIDSGSNRTVYFDDEINLVVKEEDINDLVSKRNDAISLLTNRERLYQEANDIFDVSFVNPMYHSLALKSGRLIIRHFEPDLRALFSCHSFDCCAQNYLGLKDNTITYQDVLAIKLFLTNQATTDLPFYTQHQMEMLSKLQSLNPKGYIQFCSKLLDYNRTGKSLDFAGKSNLIIDWEQNTFLINSSAIKGNSLLQFYQTLPKFASGEYSRLNRSVFMNAVSSYLVCNQILSVVKLSLPISLFTQIRHVLDNWNVIHHSIFIE
ncbi:MAG: hypothetical protein ACRCXZ_03770 [Patescibacteria group bacterium]